MELDEVKGSPSNPEGEIRETQTTEARSTESTATPHTQYRNDGETTNEALAEQARPVSKAGKSRAKGREVMCTQPGSLQSFSYVCRMFRFCGDEHVSFPTLSCEHEPNTFEKGKEDDQEDFASLTSEFDTCEVESNSSFVSCESKNVDFDFFSEGPDGDPEAFSEVFEGSETDFASLLAFWRNQEGFPGVSEESECVRMFRGLPKTVDLESDDMEEYTPSIPDQQVGPEAEAEGPMVPRLTNHPGSCPIMTLRVHIRRIWKVHHLNWRAICCTSTSVEGTGRMIEGVMRVFRQEVGHPPGDERTRSQAHVILQLISCL